MSSSLWQNHEARIHGARGHHPAEPAETRVVRGLDRAWHRHP